MNHKAVKGNGFMFCWISGSTDKGDKIYINSIKDNEVFEPSSAVCLVWEKEPNFIYLPDIVENTWDGDFVAKPKPGIFMAINEIHSKGKIDENGAVRVKMGKDTNPILF